MILATALEGDRALAGAMVCAKPMTAMITPVQTIRRARYAEAYLELVPTIHRGGARPATTFTRHLFPQFGIDLTFVGRAEALAAKAVPVVRANLLERAARADEGGNSAQFR